MILKLLGFLYLDGYTSLKAKYADPYREEFKEERHWVAENYKDYIHAAIYYKDFDIAAEMREHRRKNEYLELMLLMMEYNNEEVGQILN